MADNRPTDKQLAYICRLAGLRHPSHAYDEIAKEMGCSPAAARRNATSVDASFTISRLKRETNNPGRA